MLGPADTLRCSGALGLRPEGLYPLLHAVPHGLSLLPASLGGLPLPSKVVIVDLLLGLDLGAVSGATLFNDQVRVLLLLGEPSPVKSVSFHLTLCHN